MRLFSYASLRPKMILHTPQDAPGEKAGLWRNHLRLEHS